jgi:hypothetical protein
MKDRQITDLTGNESKPFDEKKQTVWLRAFTFKLHKTLAWKYKNGFYHAL